jgi:hypothetical protein
MNRQIVVIALLSTAALTVVALARDLPQPATEADAPTTVGTVELSDQGKTIRVTCEGIQFQSRSPRNGDDVNESNSADCQGRFDASAPFLLEYVNKKQRMERAVLSIQPATGSAYAVELRNVAVPDIDLSNSPYDSPKMAFTLVAPTSRITLRQR